MHAWAYQKQASKLNDFTIHGWKCVCFRWLLCDGNTSSSTSPNNTSGNISYSILDIRLYNVHGWMCLCEQRWSETNLLETQKTTRTIGYSEKMKRSANIRYDFFRLQNDNFVIVEHHLDLNSLATKLNHNFGHIWFTKSVKNHRNPMGNSRDLFELFIWLNLSLKLNMFSATSNLTKFMFQHRHKMWLIREVWKRSAWSSHGERIP